MKKFVICYNEYLFSKKCFEPTVYTKEAESYVDLIKDMVGIDDSPECLEGLNLPENYTDEDIINNWNSVDPEFNTEDSVRKDCDGLWNYIIFDVKENKVVHPL
jgi:hypothetical protein